jgi:hypothetical protein
MSLGLAIGPISLPTHARKFLCHALRIGSARTRRLEHYERDDRFTGGLIGAPDRRSLGDQRMRRQRRFDFHGSEPISGNVQHVVDTAGDGKVARIAVANCAAPARSAVAVVLCSTLSGKAPAPAFGVCGSRRISVGAERP